MEIRLFQVDAFTDRPFRGNPAAICPLEEWLDDDLLQAMATENQLSETAFFVPVETGYHLRWFTPVAEVDLCGHATLAAAWTLFHRLGHETDSVRFETASGTLTVEREAESLVMDFPSRPARRVTAPDSLLGGLGGAPEEVLAARRDYLIVYRSEREIVELEPNFEALARLALPGVIITAPGQEVDFVSRFFAPALGVPEDPVTGSAHCTLAPYWARRLGKMSLRARQLSARGGEIHCELRDDRVRIGGRCAPYLEGIVRIGPPREPL